jgi:hypothetical protein
MHPPPQQANHAYRAGHSQGRPSSQSLGWVTGLSVAPNSFHSLLYEARLHDAEVRVFNTPIAHTATPLPTAGTTGSAASHTRPAAPATVYLVPFMAPVVGCGQGRQDNTSCSSCSWLTGLVTPSTHGWVHSHPSPRAPHTGCSAWQAIMATAGPAPPLGRPADTLRKPWRTFMYSQRLRNQHCVSCCGSASSLGAPCATRDLVGQAAPAEQQQQLGRMHLAAHGWVLAQHTAHSTGLTAGAVVHHRDPHTTAAAAGCSVCPHQRSACVVCTLSQEAPALCTDMAHHHQCVYASLHTPHLCSQRIPCDHLRPHLPHQQGLLPKQGMFTPLLPRAPPAPAAAASLGPPTRPRPPLQHNTTGSTRA